MPPASTERHEREARVDLSVIVPVYNNAATLALLCEQLYAALRPLGLTSEFVLVNDGSADDSAACIEELRRRNSNVTFVDLNGNFGQQVAVLCGLRQASGASCIVMDADLQDPPSALPALWRARGTPALAVFAGRRGRYQSRGRHVTSLLYRSLLNLLTGLPREASMYVLMERPLVDALLAFPTRHPSIPAMIGCLGVPATTVPVKRMMRMHGRSSYTSLARVRAAAEGMACVFSYRFGAPGAPYLQSRQGEILGRIEKARSLTEAVNENKLP